MFVSLHQKLCKMLKNLPFYRENDFLIVFFSSDGSIPHHARQERPSHLQPELLHPALREKGRALPQRTIEKQAKVILFFEIILDLLKQNLKFAQEYLQLFINYSIIAIIILLL